MASVPSLILAVEASASRQRPSMTAVPSPTPLAGDRESSSSAAARGDEISRRCRLCAEGDAALEPCWLSTQDKLLSLLPDLFYGPPLCLAEAGESEAAEDERLNACEKAAEERGKGARGEDATLTGACRSSSPDMKLLGLIRRLLSVAPEAFRVSESLVEGEENGAASCPSSSLCGTFCAAREETSDAGAAAPKDEPEEERRESSVRLETLVVLVRFLSSSGAAALATRPQWRLLVGLHFLSPVAERKKPRVAFASSSWPPPPPAAPAVGSASVSSAPFSSLTEADRLKAHLLLSLCAYALLQPRLRAFLSPSFSSGGLWSGDRDDGFDIRLVCALAPSFVTPASEEKAEPPARKGEQSGAALRKAEQDAVGQRTGMKRPASEAIAAGNSWQVEALTSMQRIVVVGRYKKQSRELSQSLWLVDSRRKLEMSVEEAIGIPLQSLFDASGYRFLSAGREDADVRMLGRGRPFALELLDCRRPPHFFCRFLAAHRQAGLGASQCLCPHVLHPPTAHSGAAPPGEEMGDRQEAKEASLLLPICPLRRPLPPDRGLKSRGSKGNGECAAAGDDEAPARQAVGDGEEGEEVLLAAASSRSLEALLREAGGATGRAWPQRQQTAAQGSSSHPPSSSPSAPSVALGAPSRSARDSGEVAEPAVEVYGLRVVTREPASCFVNFQRGDELAETASGAGCASLPDRCDVARASSVLTKQLDSASSSSCSSASSSSSASSLSSASSSASASSSSFASSFSCASSASSSLSSSVPSSSFFSSWCSSALAVPPPDDRLFSSTAERSQEVLGAVNVEKAIRLALQHGAEEKVKSYECLVFADRPVSVEALEDVRKKVQQLRKPRTAPNEPANGLEAEKEGTGLLYDEGGMTIYQRTPLRVLHRRSLAVRERRIYGIDFVRIHPQVFICRLDTQAGTYVKEFVHGDLGRTSPSLSSLLNCPCHLLLLDVADLVFGAATKQEEG